MPPGFVGSTGPVPVPLPLSLTKFAFTVKLLDIGAFSFMAAPFSKVHLSNLYPLFGVTFAFAMSSNAMPLFFGT